MPQDFTNWRPPTGAQTLAGPGFAAQWDLQAGASENGGSPTLGNMLNWSQIPGVPNSVFRVAEMGDMPSVDNSALDAWLSKNRYKIMDSPSGGRVGYRWIQDARGNVIGKPTAYEKGTDKTFLAGAAAAAAIAGGGILAAQGGLGGGGGLSGMDLAADAALGTGNNITTAGGLLSGSAPAGAGIGTIANTLPAAPAAGTPLPPGPALLGPATTLPPVATVPALTGAAAGVVAPALGATNPALIESAVGTAGYGTSSAGLVGATSLFPSWLPQGLRSSWEFIKDNPKLIGALAGGLLGGVGAATGGGDQPAPYTGPMPTIKRGNWNAAPTGYDPSKLAAGGGGLLGLSGQQQPASGLGRYMGLLGR